MNIDLSAMDRAYIANLCRRRVVELDRMPGREATRQKEFIREMEYGEELAVRLDNGDSAPAQRQLPIVLETAATATEARTE